MSHLIISVSSMCCPAEGAVVERALKGVAGVAGVALDYSTRTARVTGERLAAEALLEALSLIHI